MRKKNTFDIMRIMNLMDIQDKTRLIPMSINFVEGKKVKAGALITMGVEESMLHDLVAETRIPALFMIDKATYFKLDKDESDPKELSSEDIAYLLDAFNFIAGAATIDDVKDIEKYGQYVENAASILNRLKETL